jgi:hypothetical protein
VTSGPLRRRPAAVVTARAARPLSGTSSLRPPLPNDGELELAATGALQRVRLGGANLVDAQTVQAE